MAGKVAIIGIGHVGAHVANTIAMQGLADDVYLIDINQAKVVSEIQDLNDSVPFYPHKVVFHKADFSDLKNADILINSVGKIEIIAASHDRITEMNFTIPAVRSFIGKVKDSGFKGIFINITNPCDIVTKYIADNLGLPPGHVLGTGTGLDTSRLISAIARRTGIDHTSITGYMIGEHGNRQIAVFSSVTFNGRPLDDWAKNDARFAFNRDEVEKEAVDAGWITYSGKHCTEYAIALTAARLVAIIFHNEKKVIPVSARLNGEYGETGLFAGVPAVVGADGVEEIVELPLTEKEKERFHECCNALRKNAQHVSEIP